MVDTRDLPSTTWGAGYPEPYMVQGKIYKKYMHYVYILQSKREIQVNNKKCYIGRTDDLRRRIQEHQQGKTWTTKRILPIELIFYEAFKDKQDAIRREKYLKTSKGKSTIKMMLQYSFEE